jgi:hypothetical protein
MQERRMTAWRQSRRQRRGVRRAGRWHGARDVVLWPNVLRSSAAKLLGAGAESGVIHIVADDDQRQRAFGATRPFLTRGSFPANADEVSRPVNEEPRITRRVSVVPAQATVLPKGRNCHPI